MEQQDQPFLLLNLPLEIVEKILLNLMLPDRKHIRLTCKQLYDLCNSERFCRDEKLVWWDTHMHQGNMLSVFESSTRCHYNLVIRLKKLQTPKVLPFFQKHGKKIHSLSIEKCKTSPGLVNALILHCEELCSLSLISGYNRHDSDIIADSGLNSFTLEPSEIIRPKVASLTLLLPKVEPWKTFHRISPIFPNVKYLDIQIGKPHRRRLKTEAECSTIFDDIMKLGSNLESLKLNIPLNQLFIKGSQFFDAVPNLKNLSVNFGDDKEPKEREKWCSCFRNINSISFHNLGSLRTPANWLPLLRGPELNHLSFNLNSVLTLNWEIFRALLSSQLKTIFVSGSSISMPSSKILDVPLEFNETVTDLNLFTFVKTSTLLLFSTYFHGLVHLYLSYPIKDRVLQCIFQYQENLRSLSLECCHRLSLDGFCGTEDGRLKYSIKNLKKLEHLEIEQMCIEILQSERFKREFKFRELKYLHISLVYSCNGWCPVIPLDLLEHLTSLEAVFLRDDAIPSPAQLSSLFTNLKRLNFLRISLYSFYDNCITFLNTKHLPIEDATYECLYSAGQAHHDNQLN